MPLPRVSTDAKNAARCDETDDGQGEEENSICLLCNKGIFGEVEVLTTLDCRMCPSTTYHVECVDRYVKRGVWRNRRSVDVPGSKTGLYPCPRGPEVCKGTIHSSHTKLPDTDKKRKKKAAMAALLAQAAAPAPKPTAGAPAATRPPVAPKPAPAPRSAAVPKVLSSAPQAVQPAKAASSADMIERQRAAVAAIRSELNGGAAARAAPVSSVLAAVESAVVITPKILSQPVVDLIPGAEWVEGTGKTSRRRRGGGGDKKAAADPLPPATPAAATTEVPMQRMACVQSLEQYNKLLGIIEDGSDAGAASGVGDGVSGGGEDNSSLAGSGSVESAADNIKRDGKLQEQMYYSEAGDLVTLAEYAKLYGMTARELADMYSLPYSDDSTAADIASAADGGAALKVANLVEPEQYKAKPVKEVVVPGDAVGLGAQQAAGGFSSRGLLPWQIATGHAAMASKALPAGIEARVGVAEVCEEEEVDVDDLLALCLA